MSDEQPTAHVPNFGLLSEIWTKMSLLSVFAMIYFGVKFIQIFSNATSLVDPLQIANNLTEDQSKSVLWLTALMFNWIVFKLTYTIKLSPENFGYIIERRKYTVEQSSENSN
jgi:hypothetical protein